MIDAEIIADSIDKGNRITTFRVICPRSIWPQMLTHRAFSRNAQSSRAIPTHKRLEVVENQPVTPNRWLKNRAGMQALDVEIDSPQQADLIWRSAAQSAVDASRALAALGVHKQWANRVLEPFDTITAVITATEWDNFFSQRIHHAAQPEIQELALKMQTLLGESVPVCTMFHLPFIKEEEQSSLELQTRIEACVARCARVSYLNFNGAVDVEKDLKLSQKLWEDQHLSPFEHAATAEEPDERYANFRGWQSERNRRENEPVRKVTVKS
jgi:thymidylate synthase ThyX